MKQISLGSPATITGTENSQASLSVQSMLRCRNLSLADGATTEGSLVTAAKLLAQLRNELSASPSDAFRVGFRDAAAARAWCYPGEGSDEGSMWQSGDEITVEGLQLFIVHDRVVDAYKLAHNVDSVSEATATAWAQSIADPDLYTPDSDSDIPVLNHLVFWSCPECKEGSFPDTLPNGSIRGHYFLGTIRGALKSSPTVALADTALVLGLGNCTETDVRGVEMLQSRDILNAINAPETSLIIATSIVEHPQLASVINNRPSLVEIINGWPQVVYSLIDADSSNYLYFNNTGYIDTLYVPKTMHTKYHVGFIRVSGNAGYRPIINNENDIRFGILQTGGQLALGIAWIGSASANSNLTFDSYDGRYYDVILSKTGLTVNGVSQVFSSVTNATGSYTACIGARHTSATAVSTERSDFKLRFLEIYEDDVLVKHFIPYMKDDEAVLIDIVNNEIYRNKESSQLILVNE